jgi:hypothetical protein
MKVVKNSIAQSTIEFMILFSLLLFFFILILNILNDNISIKNEEKKRVLLQNVALSVRDEISFAAFSSNGYIRTFEIPSDIIGEDYLIYINENYLYYQMGDLISSYKIFKVTGDIQKGVNIIKKENETVFLN